MPTKNRYVDFVSDEHFLKCVKWVCESYPVKSDVQLDIKKFKRNMIDPFKMLFDIINSKISAEDWIKSEARRQADKSINNRIGEFHQKLLGGVDGWEDVGKGHPLGIDLAKKDDKIFIELKNKHNTVKGDDLKNVFDKLKKVADRHPDAIVYYAYIVPEKASSGELIWKTSQREPNSHIHKAWGSKVYEIVTGDKSALEKTWKALPHSINDKYKLSSDDTQKLLEFFEAAFH